MIRPEISVIVPLGPSETTHNIERLIYLQGHGIEVVIEPGDRGISSALNRAIRRSTGAYVAWISVGDWKLQGRISQQYQAMKANGWLASCHDYTGREHPTPPDFSQLSTDNQQCGSTTMVRRDVALSIPFDEDLQWAVDWDWHAAIQFMGPGWSYINERWAKCYEHPGGHTDRGRNNPQRNRDKITVKKRWMHAPERIGAHFRTR